MEKKLIAVVFIALLGGLAGGYGLGYAIHQPQIQDLQLTLNKTEHEVLYFEGSENAVSPKFQIKGNWIRIRWLMRAWNVSSFDPEFGFGDSKAWIQIVLFFSNGTEYIDRGSSGVFSSFSNEILIKQPEEYYLGIYVYKAIKYSVVIWDYY